MVRKRENGRWEGRIVVGHKNNGEPIYRSVYAKMQKELLDKWLDDYAAPTVRYNTIAGYKKIFNYIKPILGDKQISSITTEDVQLMYRGLRECGRVKKHPKYGWALCLRRRSLRRSGFPPTASSIRLWRRSAPTKAGTMSTVFSLWRRHILLKKQIGNPAQAHAGEVLPINQMYSIRFFLVNGRGKSHKVISYAHLQVHNPHTRIFTFTFAAFDNSHL